MEEEEGRRGRSSVRQMKQSRDREQGREEEEKEKRERKRSSDGVLLYKSAVNSFSSLCSQTQLCAGRIRRRGDVQPPVTAAHHSYP
jgi:hypothetical protein